MEVQDRAGAQGPSYFPLAARPRHETFHSCSGTFSMGPWAQGHQRSYMLPRDHTHDMSPLSWGQGPNSMLGRGHYIPPLGKVTQGTYKPFTKKGHSRPIPQAKIVPESSAHHLEFFSHRKGHEEAICRGKNYTRGNVASLMTMTYPCLFM